MVTSNVAIEYGDGTVVEGRVKDFRPQRPVFHLSLAEMQGTVTEVAMDDVKAIWFDNGDSDGASDQDAHDADERHPARNNSTVVFKDGEMMEGYTRAMNLDHRGFFFTPSDTQGPDEHIFVMYSSLRHLEVNGVRIYFTNWKEG